MSVNGTGKNDPRGWAIVTLRGIPVQGGFATALEARKGIAKIAAAEARTGGRKAAEDVKARLTVAAQ